MTGNTGKETLEILLELINELAAKGEVILCGDFNSRIGQDNGTIEHDSTDFIPMPDNYISDITTVRYSQDNKTNPYGTHFLNLIKHNQLKILNGQTLGDLTGNLTSIQKRGCSVVDYFAVSKCINDQINYMKVLNFTEYSDHRPLSLQLSCRSIQISKMKPLNSVYQPAPTRFIFNENNKKEFLKLQQDDTSCQILKDLKTEVEKLQDNPDYSQTTLT